MKLLYPWREFRGPVQSGVDGARRRPDGEEVFQGKKEEWQQISFCYERPGPGGGEWGRRRGKTRLGRLGKGARDQFRPREDQGSSGNTRKKKIGEDILKEREKSSGVPPKPLRRMHEHKGKPVRGGYIIKGWRVTPSYLWESQASSAVGGMGVGKKLYGHLPPQVQSIRSSRE